MYTAKKGTDKTSITNKAVANVIQPILKVGKPDDEFEQEANKIADSVIANPVSVNGHADGNPVQRSCPSCNEEELQAKPFLQTQTIEEEEEEIQTKPNDSGNTYNSNINTQLLNSEGAGQSLNESSRNFFEPRFGKKFTGVKIHTSDSAIQMNRELNAQAFTHGSNLYFNKGKYNPETLSGKHLLAHELTHVVQQKANMLQPFIQCEVASPSPPEATLATPEGGHVAELETNTDTCNEATQQQIEAFRSHGTYGPRSLSPTDTQTGGFEAAYDPGAEILQINVRGKTRFVSGLSVNALGIVSSHESDLADLARLLNYIGDPVLANRIVTTYYTWTEAQRTEATNNFRERISDTIWIWQDAAMLHFIVNEPCWETVRANVQINIDVQDEGTARYFALRSSRRDHLQVTLVKNPERSEFQAVRDEIRAAADRVGNRRGESIDTQTDLTTGASVQSSRFTQRSNDNPYDSEMVLSNLSLQNTPSEGNDYRSMLRRSVYFKNNESALDSEDEGIINTFITDFQESDNDPTNSTVNLVGHASILGSTPANRRLVNLRLASVMRHLQNRGFPNINTRIQNENRSDTDAERYADTKSNAAIFRRVDIIVGQGGLQTTVAHEFGHVFGLLDEYASVGTSIEGTGTAPGTTVGHSGMSEAIGAGRVQSENSDNIMSLGNQVRAQHYGPFGWALHEITSKDWRVEQ